MSAFCQDRQCLGTAEDRAVIASKQCCLFGSFSRSEAAFAGSLVELLQPLLFDRGQGRIERGRLRICCCFGFIQNCELGRLAVAGQSSAGAQM